MTSPPKGPSVAMSATSTSASQLTSAAKNKLARSLASQWLSLTVASASPSAHSTTAAPLPPPSPSSTSSAENVGPSPSFVALPQHSSRHHSSHAASTPPLHAVTSHPRALSPPPPLVSLSGSQGGGGAVKDHITTNTSSGSFLEALKRKQQQQQSTSSSSTAAAASSANGEAAVASPSALIPLDECLFEIVLGVLRDIALSGAVLPTTPSSSSSNTMSSGPPPHYPSSGSSHSVWFAPPHTQQPPSAQVEGGGLLVRSGSPSLAPTTTVSSVPPSSSLSAVSSSPASVTTEDDTVWSEIKQKLLHLRSQIQNREDYDAQLTKVFGGEWRDTLQLGEDSPGGAGSSTTNADTPGRSKVPSQPPTPICLNPNSPVFVPGAYTAPPPPQPHFGAASTTSTSVSTSGNVNSASSSAPPPPPLSQLVGHKGQPSSNHQNHHHHHVLGGTQQSGTNSATNAPPPPPPPPSSTTVGGGGGRSPPLPPSTPNGTTPPSTVTAGSQQIPSKPLTYHLETREEMLRRQRNGSIASLNSSLSSMSAVSGGVVSGAAVLNGNGAATTNNGHRNRSLSNSPLLGPSLGGSAVPGFNAGASVSAAAAAAAAANSSNSTCPFDYILVLDFEATCEEPSPPNYLHEIIEFPVVVVDVHQRRVCDEFHSFVRPTVQPLLSRFCSQLTGIRQEDVDTAPMLTEVLRRFDVWYQQRIPSNARVMFATDGPWDMRDFMYNNAVLQLGVAFPSMFYQWIDVKASFGNFFRLPRSKIKTMLECLGLPLEGRLHSGLHDSRNIARIVIALLVRGCSLCDLDRIPYPPPTNASSGGTQGRMGKSPPPQPSATPLPAVHPRTSSNSSMSGALPQQQHVTIGGTSPGSSLPPSSIDLAP